MEVSLRRELLVLFLTVVIFGGVSCMNLPDQDVIDPDNEKWLADHSNYYFDYMGDAPESISAGATDLCPPLPKKIPVNACRRRKCEHDTDCRRANKRCCHNGCVRTCLRQQDPPAFIDWIKEPRSRLRSGKSWLLSGPELGQELEPCSTTPVGKNEDPLLCPHEYICHIEQPAKSKGKIPNQGHCIPETEDKSNVKEDFLLVSRSTENTT